MLFEAGQIVLNPFDLNVTSIEDADTVWMADFGRYLQTLRFLEEGGRWIEGKKDQTDPEFLTDIPEWGS